MRRLFFVKKNSTFIPDLFDENNSNEIKAFSQQMKRSYSQFIANQNNPLVFYAIISNHSNLDIDQKCIVAFRLLIATCNMLSTDTENKQLNQETKLKYLACIYNTYSFLEKYFEKTPLKSNLQTNVSNENDVPPSDNSTLSYFHQVPNAVFQENIMPSLNRTDLKNLNLVLAFKAKDKKDRLTDDKKSIIEKFEENNRVSKLSNNPSPPSFHRFQTFTHGETEVAYHPFFKELQTNAKNSSKALMNKLTDVFSMLPQISNFNEQNEQYKNIIYTFINIVFTDSTNDRKIEELTNSVKKITQKDDYPNALFLLIFMNLIHHLVEFKPQNIDKCLGLFFQHIERQFNFEAIKKRYEQNEEFLLEELKILLFIGIECRQFERVKELFDEVAAKLIIDDVSKDYLLERYLDYSRTLNFNTHITFNDESELKHSLLIQAFKERNFNLFSFILTNDYCTFFPFEWLDDFIDQAKNDNDKAFISSVIDLIVQIYSETDHIDLITQLTISGLSNQKYRNLQDLDGYLLLLIPTLEAKGYSKTLIEKIKNVTEKEQDFANDEAMICRPNDVSQIDDYSIVSNPIQNGPMDTHFYALTFHRLNIAVSQNKDRSEIVREIQSILFNNILEFNSDIDLDLLIDMSDDFSALRFEETPIFKSMVNQLKTIIDMLGQNFQREISQIKDVISAIEAIDSPSNNSNVNNSFKRRSDSDNNNSVVKKLRF